MVSRKLSSSSITSIFCTVVHILASFRRACETGQLSARHVYKIFTSPVLTWIYKSFTVPEHAFWAGILASES